MGIRLDKCIPAPQMGLHSSDLDSDDMILNIHFPLGPVNK